MYYLFFFFFSSRRRHTRWPRDWSSDVCSSDLELRVDVEDVEDVSRLAIRDANADGIDQDQPIELGRAHDCRLGGEPATEREANQRDFFARRGVDQIKGVANEVVDGVEILGPRAGAEAG